MSHIPKKRFGQHFLHERHFIDKIVNAINPQPDDVIVEIGPGQGVITDELKDRCRELHLIELDKDLVELLSERYKNVPHIKIHSIDVLKFQFQDHFTSPVKLIGNLPYNISTPIVFHLLSTLPLIQEMVFMFQKEVVDRLVAEPNSSDYSRLSVMTRFYCRASHLFDVPAGAFNPPPKVMSAVIRMKAHKLYEEIDPDLFARVVKSAFAQRRKMLRKNLQHLISSEDLSSIGLPENARAQELVMDQFIAICQKIGEIEKKRQDCE